MKGLAVGILTLVLVLFVLVGMGALLLGRSSVTVTSASVSVVEEVNFVSFNQLAELPGGALATVPGTGALLGRVVDRRGEPVPDLHVWVERSELGNDAEMHLFVAVPDPAAMVRTDALGEFTIVGLPPGEYQVFVRNGSVDLGGRSGRVEVRADHASTGLETVVRSMDRERLVTGVLLDPTGQAVSGAGIRGKYDTFMKSGSASRTTSTAGQFQFLFPPGVPLVLTATDPEGRWHPVEVEARAGNLGLVLRFVE